MLILGFDLENTPEGQLLLKRFPQARRLSLQRFASAQTWLGSLSKVPFAKAIVLAQNYRNLKLLALSAGPKPLFVLGNIGLERIDVSAPLERAVRSQVRRVRPGPPGAGNDYSEIERALPHRSRERLRASVVMPVYNRREILEKTLAAFEHQTFPKDQFEIIVADDGSHDEPQELVGRFSDRLQVSIVRQDDRGYRLSAVRNLGIREAKYPVIISLDCDMLPEADFLDAHLRWFQATERPLVVIGHRRFIDSSGLSAAQIFASLDEVRALPQVAAPGAVARRDAPVLDWRLESIRASRELKDHASPYTLASGGNIAFRKRDALEAGLFDESFEKWGGEDVEFGFRMHRLGAYFIPERAALAYHQDHPAAAPRREDAQKTVRAVRSKVPPIRKGTISAKDAQVKTVDVLLPTTEPDAIRRAQANLERTLDASLHFFTEPSSGGDRLEALTKRARGEYLYLAKPGREWPDLQSLAQRANRDPQLAALITPSGALIRARDLHRAGGWPKSQDTESAMVARLGEVGYVRSVD